MLAISVSELAIPGAFVAILLFIVLAGVTRCKLARQSDEHTHGRQMQAHEHAHALEMQRDRQAHELRLIVLQSPPRRDNTRGARPTRAASSNYPGGPLK